MTISKFIEDALFCSDPFALSYSDPDQKWIIREHLISLLHDFPSLKPSVADFTHNDGTDVKLLNATGDLPLSPHAPPVPLTIWLHELYPHAPPLVFINAGNSSYPIYEHYPFADSSSGATSSAYIANWHFSKSSLSGLARNLVKLFCHNHPFYYNNNKTDSCDRWAHPFTASRMEAMDRLACSLYYDTVAITARTRDEIENLAVAQAGLRDRSETIMIVMSEVEEERRRLKSRAGELCEEADKVLNWLKVYGANPGFDEVAIDDVFEGLDERSEAALEVSAADLAVEDLMYELEKAVNEGVVSFDVYLRQVRILAREQFFHRAKLEKIRSSNFVS
ncbi:hypothetical protein C2S52_018731 [Perilla frutescens var. hirtella]|nr:hypothetical protein C2S52_018731 [Perilla frutescens var. hirtella]